MKLVPVLAATVAFGLLAATPAAAQYRHDRHWSGDRHHGWYGQRDGWHRHRYWRPYWRHPCRWVWRYHRRVRVCW